MATSGDFHLSESLANMSNDELIEAKVLIFKEMILKSVNAMELLSLMPALITREDKMKIRHVNRHEGPSKATEELLEIIKHKTEQGRWQTLIDALRIASYENIANGLSAEGKYEPSVEQNQLVEIFSKELEDRINVTEILPHLISKDVLTTKDSEEIKAEYDNSGAQAGALLLVMRIPCKSPNWFQLFLEVLDDNQYQEIVDLLDPLFRQKRKQKYSDEEAQQSKAKKIDASSSEDEDDNGIKEDYASMSGEAYMSHDNLGAPPADDSIQNIDENTPLKRELSSQVPTEHDESLEIILNTEQRNNMSTEEVKEQIQNVNKDMEDILGFNEPPPNLPPGGLEMSMVSEVDNRSDSDSDSEVEVNQATSELKLRSYQLELARKGLEGTNCLVVAPTGSGKTHVALKIIQEHMEKTGRRRMPKVIFLLEQSALADQQSKMCRKYLNCSVKLITGEVQRSENFRELSQWIKRYDILVVTAQLLVNALMEKDVDIKNFSLMVFDECHHANLKHAYNRIMHQYLDLKLDDTVSTGSLPQVIGLTASVGCGKAKNKYEAVEWIEKIMAHLDAEAIVTVNQHKNELMEHAIVPEQIKKVVPGRKNNLFGEAVSNLMTMIERLMAQSEYAQQNKECVRILQPPAVKGKEQYTGWVSEIWRETAQISDQRAMRFFRTCRNYLEVYNKALIIYSDARVKDALEFLDEEMSKLMALKPKNDIDEKMETLFQKSRNIMENCLYNDENPKLQELKNMLIKAYREKPDYRGIIFVRTRDLARAIESWMRDTRELKGLNPVKFVGAVSHDGMTKQEQVDVLQFFREGKHKIIIATSVAQEGLDIQECTLVIPYNYATNEIAMVQSRGRARDKDNSKYIALVEEGGQAAKKEELNIMREMMMQDAITEVQHKMSRNSDTFLQNLLDIQKQEKRARDQKAHTERTMKDGEFNLRCGRCNNFICMSYDIRKIERAHFAVTAEDITKYIVATKCVENGAQFIAHSIRSGFGKIACKACGFDLGNVTLYKEIQFPIIKIKSFIVEDAYGSRASWKKWIKVPFSVKELGEAELLRQSSYPVLIDPYN